MMVDPIELIIAQKQNKQQGRLVKSLKLAQKEVSNMQAHNATGQCDKVEADRGKYHAGGTLQPHWMQHQIPLADHERQAQRTEISGCAEKGAGNRC